MASFTRSTCVIHVYPFAPSCMVFLGISRFIQHRHSFQRNIDHAPLSRLETAVEFLSINHSYLCMSYIFTLIIKDPEFSRMFSKMIVKRAFFLEVLVQCFRDQMWSNLVKQTACPETR